MQPNTAFKFFPIFSDEKRVEIALIDDQVAIRLSTWEEDLGWCGQKTMTLDAAMLEELHRVIAAARVKLKSQKIEDQEEVKSSKVIQFPSI